MDESVKLLQTTCLDQTKKHQVYYKREYTKVAHAFSKLARAFDMDPSSCKFYIQFYSIKNFQIWISFNYYLFK